MTDEELSACKQVCSYGFCNIVLRFRDCRWMDAYLSAYLFLLCFLTCLSLFVYLFVCLFVCLFV